MRALRGVAVRFLTVGPDAPDFHNVLRRVDRFRKQPHLFGWRKIRHFDPFDAGAGFGAGAGGGNGGKTLFSRTAKSR
jgi:hypothetical protein